MGKQNDALSFYLDRAAILADLYNGSLYQGKSVISANELAEIQKTYHENLQNRYGQKRRPRRRERDAAKVLCRNGHFVILAVENQDKPHLFMPLRILEYDVTDFVKQIRRLKRHYRENGGLNQEEYLSGIRRTDRLIPVITLVLYFGKEKWTEPTQLMELMDTANLDETLTALHVNYQIHLINVMDLDENNFQTGLRELIGLMKRSDDKAAMLAYCEENQERFRSLDDDTYDVICAVLNVNSLAVQKENCRNQGKEKYDVCKAIQDLINDSKMEGKMEGEKIGAQKGEEMLANLIDLLLTDNRVNDMKKALKSKAFRKKMYQEYGLLTPAADTPSS